MLVIKVYVTKQVPIRKGESLDKRDALFHIELEEIDEIRIQQIAKKVGDLREYGIVKPEGIKATITHVRSDGYRPLLEKALALLEGLPKRAYKRKVKESGG